jgi:3-carboxy-cis,cis-muconate cycloisomerase
MTEARGIVSHFSPRARLQAMLDVEAALAEAEASAGVIPHQAPDAIKRACRADLFDVASLEGEAERDGNLAIPLVRQLTARVGDLDREMARYVHWGATSQDIIDTGVILQLRAAVPPMVADLKRAADASARHAERHATTIMPGRTWLQQATPITFGLKAAGWCDALDRVSNQVEAALNAALVLQFGGASGTLAALGRKGPEVATRLGTALGLTVPSIPWHTHRDRLVSLACVLGVATGAMGKIGRDLTLLAQTEVEEAHEPATDAGNSSTMPHKRNPVRAAIVVAAAMRTPGLVSTMLSCMLQEHERGVGSWPAEWDTLPTLVMVTAQAAAALAAALEALSIEPQRMRDNLELTGGLVLAEAVAMRLAPKLGKKEAHAIIGRVAARATAEKRPFAEVLGTDASVTAVLSRSDIDEALAPEAYLGSAGVFVTNVLTQRRR